MNFIFLCSARHLTRSRSSWTLKDKIHIHVQACNILYLLLLQREVHAFVRIWIPSSCSQLHFWCPGFVYFKLLSNVPRQKTPLEECSSEATRLNQQWLDGQGGVIWCVKKNSSVKATILSLAIKSANWTIEPRKRDLKISKRIRQGFTWNEQETEVHFSSSFVYSLFQNVTVWNASLCSFLASTLFWEESLSFFSFLASAVSTATVQTSSPSHPRK